MTIKLAIIGRKRSGKDTVVDELIKRFQKSGLSCKTFALGDSLKQFAHEIYFDYPLDKKPRELYQFMNVMRDFDKDVWVKHLDRKLTKSTEKVQIITDIRQKNELNYAQKNAFILIKVFAEKDVRKQRTINSGEDWVEEFENHPSETYTDIAPSDYTIENNGTLEQLHGKISDLFKIIRAEHSDEFIVSKDDELKIYTDGACSNNQGENSVGSWGFVCVVNDQVISKVSGKNYPDTTNNIMELMAVIQALFKTVSYQKDYSKISIHTDSAYVLNGITQWIHNWRKNDWVNSKGQPVANKELWEDLYELTLKFDNLEWVKVKGHSGDKWNELADDLASGRVSLDE